VQILFAFLLTMPFSARFEQTTQFQRDLYVVTLLCAAGATALLIAPVSIHRFLFRARKKKLLVAAGNLLAHGGLLLLMLAVVGSVLLVLDEVVGGARARWMAVGTALWFAAFWYALPLGLRSSGHVDQFEGVSEEEGDSSGGRSGVRAAAAVARHGSSPADRDRPTVHTGRPNAHQEPLGRPVCMGGGGSTRAGGERRGRFSASLR
jgi:hypothetical protein